MKRIVPALIVFTTLLLYSCSADTGPVEEEPGTPSGTDNPVSFSQEVQPVFDQNCTSCHPSSGNLDLTAANSYSSLVNVPASGYSAVRVVPGDPESSVLYGKINGSNTFGSNMPLGGSLSAAQIDIIKRWIEQGAEDN